MYEDENTYRLKIDWKSLLLKLVLIILAILLIIWIFPMPKLDTFYSKVYNDNLQTMKSAAKSYYTVDNLPANIGESATLKLQDMLDKKLIVEFVDKDNKTCDNNNSYVQVTKTTTTDYVLKVQLACTEKTDYILENLSTASTCTATTCVANNNTINDSNKSNTSNSSNTNSVNNSSDDEEDIIVDGAKYDKDGNLIGELEYQFKKENVKTNTTYTCPDGYVKDGNVCYKYEVKETIDATKLYFEDITTKTDAKKNETGEYKVYAEVVKTSDGYTYSCPEGYTQNKDICYKYVNATVVPGTTTYTCSEGTLSNDKCVITVNASKQTVTGNYYCANGGTLNGSTCVYNATYHNGDTSCTCPNGGSLNGSTCSKSNNYAASESWSNPTVTNTTTALSEYNNGSTKRVLISKTPLGLGKYNYVYYTYQMEYSCPNGGTLSGTTCYKDESYNASCSTTSSYYTCDNGGTLNGTTCTYEAKQDVNYVTTCPDGYMQDGDTCKKTINADKHVTETSYTCPDGYVKDGTTCYQYKELNKTEKVKYSCPDGYTAEGEKETMKCYKTIASTITYYCEDATATLDGDKCIKTTKGTFKGYSCPDGYILYDDKCIMKSKTYVDATAHTETESSWAYKWSTSKTLDGWTFTGKVRVKGTTTIIDSYEK